ncbi:MAG: glycosyl transferase family 28 [Propionibacteriales bacterium]|nr:glycosyl transferase family 28 [Propionibacteriales bacterium]
MNIPRRRVALYLHDTQGLGHVRRNSLIAAALVRDDPSTEVLLLSGAGEATSLPLPPHTEVVTLPGLRKDAGGRYEARALPSPLADVLALRASILEASLAAFEPDLLVVDKVPRGVGGELDRALVRLRRDTGVRTVLGLRDVLDSPAVATREWAAQRSTRTVDSHYDAVWVYGDRRIYDPVVEYGLPESVARKVSYTGYLGRGPDDSLVARHYGRSATPPAGRSFVLCLVGGGQDGSAVARAFVDADLPVGHRGVLVTGPFMNRRLRQRLAAEAARRRDLQVREFVPDVVPFVAAASAVVSMGGYNSVCEVLSAAAPALLVPRTTPRAEQAVRAERLRAAGLVDVLAGEPDPARLTGWLSAAVNGERPTQGSVDLAGLDRVPLLARALLASDERAIHEERADVAV